MLTIERLHEIADCCSQKARDVLSGRYGPNYSDVPNSKWARDLRDAARLLHHRQLSQLSCSHLEEIQFCGIVDDSEVEEIDRERLAGVANVG
jgi:hypothetical protein